MYKTILSLSLLLGVTVQGFVLPSAQQQHSKYTSLNAKGFGESPTPKKKKAALAPVIIDPNTIVDPEQTTFSEEPTQDLSMGKAALERMRRERAEKRNAELRQIKEVQEVDAMLQESPGAAAIPEKVAQRMGKRLLPFVGIPLIGGMGSFVGFWYMATYRDMEFQPALVAASTIALLAVGLVVRMVFM